MIYLNQLKDLLIRRHLYLWHRCDMDLVRWSRWLSRQRVQYRCCSTQRPCCCHCLRPPDRGRRLCQYHHGDRRCRDQTVLRGLQMDHRVRRGLGCRPHPNRHPPNLVYHRYRGP